METTGSLQLQFFNHPEGYVEPVINNTTKSVKGYDAGSGEITYSAFKYVFQFKDHLGNIRLSYSDDDLNGSIDPNDEIIEESNYYPFGLKQNGYNNTVSSSGNSIAQKIKYQGQELEEDLGKNTYAFQWRDYDPTRGRFDKIDRFAEKYYSQSPYGFTVNNPIYFREIRGDSINVAEEYREQFNNVLESFFGDKAQNFEYDKNGNLQYSGTKKDFKGKERKLFKGLNKVINSETVTDVVFEEEITVNGIEISVEGEGGAITILAGENEGLDKNIIAVDPNATNQLNIPIGLGFKDGSFQALTEKSPTKISTNTMHEIGHVLYEGQDQTNVIKFDNLARSLHKTRQSNGTFKGTPLRARPATDLTHSPATIETKIGN